MQSDPRSPKNILRMATAALGVVFGDIGTSPLYALKTVLDVSRDTGPETVLGILSLIVWTLILIATVKYITIAMQVDNDGEGGILGLELLAGRCGRILQSTLVDIHGAHFGPSTGLGLYGSIPPRGSHFDWSSYDCKPPSRKSVE
jgi:K+ transporter